MVVFFSYLSGEPEICPVTMMESPGLNPFGSLLLNGRLWSEKETSDDSFKFSTTKTTTTIIIPSYGIAMQSFKAGIHYTSFKIGTDLKPLGIRHLLTL